MLAAAPEPVVHRLPIAAAIFPQGARPGDSFEAEVLGEHLDRATTVEFFDRDIQATIEQASATRCRLKVQASAQARFGPHYFRIVTPRGASGPLLLRIGDLPRVREVEPNTALGQAMLVAAPVTIDGRLDRNGDYDFYRFRARAGERWVFDLRAARNGNGLDAALLLLDAKGNRLAHSEDRFVWDPFFAYRFAAEGEYIAVVQPTHTNNDPAFAYELDIRQSPYLETMAPLSLMPGTSTEVTVFGAALEGEGAQALFEEPGFQAQVMAMRNDTALVRVTVPADAAPGERQMVLRTAGGRSNAVRFLVDATPQAAGNELRPPVARTGTARYRQPERFPFTAGKDEKWVFEVRANRFGSPADVVLRIYDEAGKTVAMNDDYQFPVADFYNRDPRLAHTFQEGGKYTLEVRNTVASSGENYPYQLLVTHAAPHFELTLSEDRPYIYPGKRCKLRVTAIRRDGHDASIALALTGLPPGIRVQGPAVIPAGATEAEIVLEADASVRPGLVAPVEVSAGPRKAWRPVRVSSGGGEGATFAPVARAALTVAMQPNFSLEAAVSEVPLPKGAAAALPVMIRREPGFRGPIRFALENAPQGVTLEPAEAGPEADRIELRVRAAANAPPARQPRVTVIGISGDEQQQAPRISIDVD